MIKLIIDLSLKPKTLLLQGFDLIKKGAKIQELIIESSKISDEDVKNLADILSESKELRILNLSIYSAINI